MFRYNNGQFKQTPPATVEYQGFMRTFSDLTREQWDELGYNEAILAKREPFTTYTTQWVKGNDLIYREEILTTTMDESAQANATADTVRAERDKMLMASDWTQLADSTLNDEDMALWKSYRQTLRDMPQQVGFPLMVKLPVAP